MYLLTMVMVDSKMLLSDISMVNFQFNRKPHVLFSNLLQLIKFMEMENVLFGISMVTAKFELIDFI